MSENKTIKNYTATDIEKYWNKKLTPIEMRELEKAAMDDSFLADALEGYKNSKNPEKELDALKDRFGKRLNEETPVIPLLRKKYYWFRVAAAIIILLGSGLLIQQLFYKNKNESSVANVTAKEEAKQDVKVSVNPLPLDTLKKEGTITESVTNKPVSNKPNSSVDLNSSFAITTPDSIKADNKAYVLEYKDVSKPAKEDTLLAKESEKKEAVDDKKASALNEVVVAPAANNRSTDADKFAKAKAFAQTNNQNGAIISNRFNYRVVDAQKNPIPFANVMNTRDNVGTYTDIKGYFNLVSSDSTMNVQVKSLGFNSENYKLTASKQTNDLVLKEDASLGLLMDVNQGRQRVMNNVVRKDSAEIIEPVVGWGNYNTYVENNIKIPEKNRSKNATNQVELSFDVDKTGTPVNIAVSKSSQCKECDEEAIRLLKEGPKWKKKGKKSKTTTITISVDQK